MCEALDRRRVTIQVELDNLAALKGRRAITTGKENQETVAGLGGECKFHIKIENHFWLSISHTAARGFAFI